MEFFEVVRRRRMVRSYDPSRAVPNADREAIIDAALTAPSAGFTQGVSLLILESPEERSRFWSDTAGQDTAGQDADNSWLRGMWTAPLLIVVWTSRGAYLDRYSQPDKGWTDRDAGRWTAPYWFVDAGMASMSALLSIVDHELVGCFFGVPPERIESLRTSFAVPEDQLAVGVISVGYRAAEQPKPGSPRRRQRKDPAELVHRGRWSRAEKARAENRSPSSPSVQPSP